MNALDGTAQVSVPLTAPAPPTAPRCFLSTTPPEIQLRIMRMIPCFNDRLSLAETSATMAHHLIRLHARVLFWSPDFSRTVFVGEHFAGQDANGAFDDRTTLDTVGVATMTRSRRLNEDVPSPEARRKILQAICGAKPWPHMFKNKTYLDYFSSLRTDLTQPFPDPERALLRGPTSSHQQECHTILRRLRREDEWDRFMELGGKAYVLHRNLVAFFRPQRPLPMVDRCRSIECLAQDLASELMKNDKLYCPTCYRTYCEKFLVDIDALAGVGFDRNFTSLFDTFVTVKQCISNGLFISKEDARLVLNTFFRTDVTRSHTASLEMLNRDKHARKLGTDHWRTCAWVYFYIRMLFSGDPRAIDTHRYHLKASMLGKYYKHHAKTLSQQDVSTAAFEFIAASYDAYKEQRKTRSYPLHKWAADCLAALSHKILEEEYGVITSGRLKDMYGITVVATNEKEREFVEIAVARKEAQDKGTTLEQLQDQVAKSKAQPWKRRRLG